MKILSLFTYPHVIPNLYAFISAAEHKIRYFEVENQTVSVPIDFHCLFVFFCPYNRSQWEVGFQLNKGENFHFGVEAL